MERTGVGGSLPMHATQQAAGLETRLRHAETKLAALTPPEVGGNVKSREVITIYDILCRP